MASYTLSGAAEEDIENIAEDSVSQWGLPRAKDYILALQQAFERLAAFPDLGRDASRIRPGYFRIISGSHVVFYRKIAGDVLIVRVLHERMDFARHLQ